MPYFRIGLIMTSLLYSVFNSKPELASGFEIIQLCLGEQFMNEFEIDLSVGETIRIGECLVTIVESENNEVEIEIQKDGDSETHQLTSCAEVLANTM